MPALLHTLLHLFLTEQKKKSEPTLATFAGYFLITIGATCGGYFLFNFLAPRIGYFEAGGLLSIALVGIGITSLYVASKKKEKINYLDEAALLIKTLPSGIDIVKFLVSNRKRLATILFIIVVILALFQRARKTILG